MSWERRIEVRRRIAQPAQRLSDIENRFRIQLPQTYKSAIADAEGCRPSAPYFAIAKSESRLLIELASDDVDGLDIEEIDTFLFASDGAAGHLDDIYSIDSWLKRVSPILENVVPFAIDLADNPLCFFYKGGISEPAIVYIDMEREANDSLWFVAPSFSSLLENLLREE